jgi:hypothetical protein
MMKGVQITNIIKCTLELSSGSYTQWRNLMELAIEESGALDHINWDGRSRSRLAHRRSDLEAVDLRHHLAGAHRHDYGLLAHYLAALLRPRCNLPQQ